MRTMRIAFAAAIALSALVAGASAAGQDRLIVRDKVKALANNAWGQSAAGLYLAGRQARIMAVPPTFSKAPCPGAQTTKACAGAFFCCNSPTGG